MASAQDVALTDSELADDLVVIKGAYNLWLNSRMREAEGICLQFADRRLYYSFGYTFNQSLKALATFDPSDLTTALETCQRSISIGELVAPLTAACAQF